MSSSRVLHSRIVVLAFAVLLILGAFGVAGCSEKESAAPVTDPVPVPAPVPDNGAGSEIPEPDSARTLVESKCSGCHELDRVWAKTQDRAGWESTVARMEGNGMRVTDDERETIVDFLSNQ